MPAVTVTDKLLAEMVAVVVREADPERIYLFGSYARNEATPESDVDLLVVERNAPDGDPHQEMARIWRVLAQFRVSKDIIVCSVDDVERRKNWRNHVIARALREGRLLYERH